MNKPSIERRPWLQAALGALVLSALPAQAAYPDKTIRLIVPFPAGGAADVMARGMAQRLSAELGGQQVVIDNRGGAGGTTGNFLMGTSLPLRI